VRVKKVFETPSRLSGMTRFEMCVTEGSERSALHHSCAVKSSRCSILMASDACGLIVGCGGGGGGGGGASATLCGKLSRTPGVEV
jgi:hypothetical protein